MSDKEQSKQVDELKELREKNLSEQAKKVIDKKIKGMLKPFSK